MLLPSVCYAPDDSPAPVEQVPDLPPDTTAVDSPASSPPAEAAPEAPPAWSLREFAAGRGIDSLKSLKSDEEAATAVFDEYQRIHAAHTAQQRQYAELQARLDAMQRQPAPVPAPQAQKPKWEAKQYDPAWVTKLERDENGRFVPNDAYKKIEEYKEWQQANLHKFFEAPDQFMAPLLKDHVTEWIQEAVQQQVGGVTGRITADKWIQQNDSWLYARDANGGYVYNPGGGKALSQAGYEYDNEVQRLSQFWNGPPEALYEQAKRNVQHNYAMRKLQQSQQAPPAPAAPVADTKKEEFLNGNNGVNRIARIPNRNGNVAPPEPEAPAANSFLQIALAEARKQGILN